MDGIENQPTEEPIATVTPLPTEVTEPQEPIIQEIVEVVDLTTLEAQVQALGQEVALINVQAELQSNVLLFSLGLCVSLFVCWLLYRLIKIFI